jgi:hypothetical protein
MKIGEEIEELQKLRDEAVVKLLRKGATRQRCAELCGVAISKVDRLAKEYGLTKRAQQMDVLPESGDRTFSAEELMVVLDGTEITAEEARRRK